nr:hypothetical protein [Tanacetum cinerariifolium]
MSLYPFTERYAQPYFFHVLIRQYEVNEIRAEKIERVANPLALVAQKQQSHHPHTYLNHFNQNSSTRTHQSATRKREKADNSPWIHRNDGYEGQRSGTVAGARATVGSSMVQISGIQCYNYKEYGHVARECQKPKRAKDVAYHREKMLLYRGFVVLVVGGGVCVGVDCGGGGVKDGNDYWMTMVNTGEDLVITEIGNI